MIEGRGEATINRPAKDCYDFVLDLDRYRTADEKVGKVFRIDFDGRNGEVFYSGKINGLPGPPMTHLIEADPYRRIVIRTKPRTWQAAVSPFYGEFTFEEVDDSTTRVVHVERLAFKGPWRTVMERALANWLEADTPAEVARMKAALEA